MSIAFWWDAPIDRRARQELELNLILKWRSPLNIVSKDTSSGATIFSLWLQSNVLYTVFGNQESNIFYIKIPLKIGNIK